MSARRPVSKSGRAGDRPGAARSPEAAERLARFERVIELPLILAAVLPIVLSLTGRRSAFGVFVYVASWIVFLVDLVVTGRLTRHYLRTWRGLFDLAIVILTAPWFFITGLGSSRSLVLARLARIARLFMTKSASRLIERLGRAALVGAGMVLVCADVAYHAEKATNPEFASYADALWWGVVTICTVGYGDIVPRTAEGRWAGALLMITGIGIIGALAGSLASFLRLQPGATAPRPAPGPKGWPARGSPATDSGPEPDTLAAEIAAVRAQLSDLDAHLERLEHRAGQSGPPAREAGQGPPAREAGQGPPAREAGQGPPAREAEQGPPAREAEQGPPDAGPGTS